MKALTINQPHASLIRHGIKLIETRKHDRFIKLKGQRIAIHAGKRYDDSVLYLPDWWRDHGAFDIQWTKTMTGMILCTALVHMFKPIDESYARESCVQPSQFKFGLYGLFLRDIQPLKNQIPYKGQQGIWNVPDELIQDNL